METSELKNNIRKAIDSTSDEDLLKLVYELLITSQPEVVGYENNREITRLELLKRAFEAESDYQKGRTMTVEEVKEKFETGRRNGKA